MILVVWQYENLIKNVYISFQNFISLIKKKKGKGWGDSTLISILTITPLGKIKSTN